MTEQEPTNRQDGDPAYRDAREPDLSPEEEEELRSRYPDRQPSGNRHDAVPAHPIPRPRNTMAESQAQRPRQPAPYDPPHMDPQDLQEATYLINDYRFRDQPFNDYLIDTAQRFLKAGAPIDERIERLCHRTIAQLKHKYPNEVRLASPKQMEAASQALCSIIIDDTTYLKDMAKHYWVKPPMEVAQSNAPMEIMQQGERLGRAMLKDPAIRNICTHMAYRMARLTVDASGSVEFDGQQEIKSYTGMARAYLSKHPETQWHLSDGELKETGRWLAQQVNERANDMVPNELTVLWKETGTIPNPMAGEYASQRFEERDWLAANLHTYNKGAQARALEHEPMADTAQIPAVGKPEPGEDTKAPERRPNPFADPPAAVEGHGHRVVESQAQGGGRHIFFGQPQPTAKQSVSERLRNAIGKRVGHLTDDEKTTHRNAADHAAPAQRGQPQEHGRTR